MALFRWESNDYRWSDMLSFSQVSFHFPGSLSPVATRWEACSILPVDRSQVRSLLQHTEHKGVHPPGRREWSLELTVAFPLSSQLGDGMPCFSRCSLPEAREMRVHGFVLFHGRIFSWPASLLGGTCQQARAYAQTVSSLLVKGEK